MTNTHHHGRGHKCAPLRHTFSARSAKTVHSHQRHLSLLFDDHHLPLYTRACSPMSRRNTAGRADLYPCVAQSYCPPTNETTTMYPRIQRARFLTSQSARQTKTTHRVRTYSIILLRDRGQCGRCHFWSRMTTRKR
ncbi:hypothetical protein BDZ89DRAFT_494311 [Hymenopellis radicata]|nr:hypothetical protein BDZ89DRAFT_494311 [Hymenopellis radicata]